MKTVVLAYHTIGCRGIEALLRNGFEIAAVFTHKDDPDENIWFESVAELAASRNIPVYAPEDINHPLWVKKIREIAPDIIFSFYYRNLIRPPILDIPPAGCLNLHGSLSQVTHITSQTQLASLPVNKVTEEDTLHFS